MMNVTMAAKVPNIIVVFTARTARTAEVGRSPHRLHRLHRCHLHLVETSRFAQMHANMQAIPLATTAVRDLNMRSASSALIAKIAAIAPAPRPPLPVPPRPPHRHQAPPPNPSRLIRLARHPASLEVVSPPMLEDGAVARLPPALMFPLTACPRQPSQPFRSLGDVLSGARNLTILGSTNSSSRSRLHRAFHSAVDRSSDVAGSSQRRTVHKRVSTRWRLACTASLMTMRDAYKLIVSNG
mmetsp:Transcript_12837/g.25888  ORF Transcript_12837/g.25888 Transcript_12837/m.25888 type:complete len:240 (-) Transcript_12837:1713-2432(-)